MAKYFHSTDCIHSPRNLKWPNHLTVLAVSEGSYCPATWDSLACWPQTKAGETAVISCPNYLNQFDSAGIYMHVNYIQTCSSRHLFFFCTGWFLKPFPPLKRELQGFRIWYYKLMKLDGKQILFSYFHLRLMNLINISAAKNLITLC